MKNSIKDLSAFGYDTKYKITDKGEVLNTAKNSVVRRNNQRIYKL